MNLKYLFRGINISNKDAKKLDSIEKKYNLNYKKKDIQRTREYIKKYDNRFLNQELSNSMVIDWIFIWGNVEVKYNKNKEEYLNNDYFQKSCLCFEKTTFLSDNNVSKLEDLNFKSEINRNENIDYSSYLSSNYSSSNDRSSNDSSGSYD